MDNDLPAARHLTQLGIAHGIVHHEPVSSLADAARARGIAPHDLVKTLVVRKSNDAYLFVLVPGDRKFSWPKLRALLGTTRLSMPDAATAQQVTGYARGTITPFGASHPWPVIADQSIVGRRISMGAGVPHTGITLSADDVIAGLSAEVADITDESTTE